MIKIICIITVLLFAIGAGIQFKSDPGYVLIAINHWTIETTLSVVMFSFILLLTLVYTLFSLFSWLIAAPKAWHQWRIQRIYQKALKKTPQSIIKQATYLLEHHQDEQAERILRHYLHKKYNEAIMNLYGLIQPNQMKLSFVESLLKKNPNAPALYLCLARINQSKQLWGKARICFEKSIHLAPTATAYLELGLLLERLQQPSDAYTAYKTGLCLSAQKKNICL